MLLRRRMATLFVVLALAGCASVNRHRTGTLHDFSLCLIRRFESALGGVPIGADWDPALRSNKQAEAAS